MADVSVSVSVSDVALFKVAVFLNLEQILDMS